MFTCVHTRSYGRLCLVLALKEATQTPFLALDEFDVFMDERNRKVSLMTLCQVRGLYRIVIQLWRVGCCEITIVLCGRCLCFQVVSSWLLSLRVIATVEVSRGCPRNRSALALILLQGHERAECPTTTMSHRRKHLSAEWTIDSISFRVGRFCGKPLCALEAAL